MSRYTHQTNELLYFDKPNDLNEILPENIENGHPVTYIFFKFKSLGDEDERVTELGNADTDLVDLPDDISGIIVLPAEQQECAEILYYKSLDDYYDSIFHQQVEHVRAVDDLVDNLNSTVPETTADNPSVNVVCVVEETMQNGISEVGNQRAVEHVIDDLDSVEDVPPLTNKRDIQWVNIPFRQSLSLQWDYYCDPNINLKAPIDYFYQYITTELLEIMAEMTNLYATQQAKNFVFTNSAEICVLIGLHMYMSCLKYPRVRMYWERDLKLSIFSETMTAKRFFQLRSNLHLVNNLSIPLNNADKFFKVRPIFESLRERCKKLSVEEEVAVDEQIIPFRGTHGCKQYIRGKPNPWSIKVYALCGKSGLCYDFVIYQGKSTEIDPDILKTFGFCAGVVVQLSKRLVLTNHKLFFDNFSTTYNLLEYLSHRDIKAAGTIRSNRFKNPHFTSDKEMSKKPRGYAEEMSSADGKIVLTKWCDTRTVSVASNFIGIGSSDTVRRWDANKKTYIHIDRPEVIRRYNLGMGGVDHMDHHLSLYRIFIKSKKWTLRLIFHAIDMAVVNSWNEYRRECSSVGETPLDLLHFKLRIAEVLVKGNNTTSRKRGRPSKEPKKRESCEVTPNQELRYDNISHWPEATEGPIKRCKNDSCEGRTYRLTPSV